MADLEHRPPVSTQRRDKPPDSPPSHARRWPAILARSILLLLFIIGFIASMLPWGRAAIDTTVIIPALVTASEPLPLKFSGDSIRHTQMTIASTSGPVFLDLYMPTTPVPLLSGSHRAILIIPGVGDNRTVPQLVNLAQTLARSGIVAMTMATPTLINYDISANDTDAVVQAFKTLARIPGVGAHRIGILAFSGATPLACFAAADPRIKAEVAYLILFGGYYNAQTLLYTFGKRAMTIDGKTVPWQPDPVPIEVMTNIVAPYLSPADRQLIQNALASGGKPLTTSQIARLSPTGRAAYQLLTGSAPSRVKQNIAQLPPALLSQLYMISPQRVVGQIEAPIFLLHDISDPSIPFTQSLDFAQALARLHHPYRFVELHFFNHVLIETNLQLTQMLSSATQLAGVLIQMLQTTS